MIIRWTNTLKKRCRTVKRHINYQMTLEVRTLWILFIPIYRTERIISHNL